MKCDGGKCQIDVHELIFKNLYNMRTWGFNRKLS